MKKYVHGAFAMIGFVTLALGLASPAVAMPVEVGSATDTVNKLQAQGYRVILNKVGTGSLDHCTVTAVRPGHQVTQPGVSREGGRDPVQTVLYTTVNVDVKC